jgi:hypothetical protein
MTDETNLSKFDARHDPQLLKVINMLHTKPESRKPRARRMIAKV